MDLPPGFHWETDAKYGWAVGVPNGWKRGVSAESDSMIEFTDETDGRWKMAIDTSFTPPAGDPVKDWEGQEAARLRNRMYDNYQRVGIAPKAFRDGWACADWQWIYSLPAGQVHVSNLGCRVNPGRGHAIYWRTPAELWTDPAAINKYNIISVSFRVV